MKFIRKIRSYLTDCTAALELTGRAEKEYNRIMAELKKMTPEERKEEYCSRRISCRPS